MEMAPRNKSDSSSDCETPAENMPLEAQNGAESIYADSKCSIVNCDELETINKLFENMTVNEKDENDNDEIDKEVEKITNQITNLDVNSQDGLCSSERSVADVTLEVKENSPPEEEHISTQEEKHISTPEKDVESTPEKDVINDKPTPEDKTCVENEEEKKEDNEIDDEETLESVKSLDEDEVFVAKGPMGVMTAQQMEMNTCYWDQDRAVGTKSSYNGEYGQGSKYQHVGLSLMDNSYISNINDLQHLNDLSAQTTAMNIPPSKLTINNQDFLSMGIQSMTPPYEIHTNETTPQKPQRTIVKAKRTIPDSPPKYQFPLSPADSDVSSSGFPSPSGGRLSPDEIQHIFNIQQNLRRMEKIPTLVDEVEKDRHNLWADGLDILKDMAGGGQYNIPVENLGAIAIEHDERAQSNLDHLSSQLPMMTNRYFTEVSDFTEDLINSQPQITSAIVAQGMNAPPATEVQHMNVPLVTEAQRMPPATTAQRMDLPPATANNLTSTAASLAAPPQSIPYRTDTDCLGGATPPQPSSLQPYASSSPESLVVKKGLEEPLREAGIILSVFKNQCVKLMRTLEDHSIEEIIARDEQGDTHLHIACMDDERKGKDVYAILCKLHRSDLLHEIMDSPNIRHHTPLYLACTLNYPEIAALLLNFGADPNMQQYNPQKNFSLSALHCIAQHGRTHLSVLRVLLADPRTDVNLTTQSGGKTAVHVAAEKHGRRMPIGDDQWKTVNSILLIQTLIANGIDLSIKDMKGNPAMHAVIQTGKLDLIVPIVGGMRPEQARAALEAENNEGNTCLHVLGNMTLDVNTMKDLAFFIMDKGVNVQIRNKACKVARDMFHPTHDQVRERLKKTYRNQHDRAQKLVKNNADRTPSPPYH